MHVQMYVALVDLVLLWPQMEPAWQEVSELCSLCDVTVHTARAAKAGSKFDGRKDSAELHLSC